MYPTIDNNIIQEIDNTLQYIIELAHTKKWKGWEDTVDYYTGYQTFLRKQDKLSPSQCAKIKRGCYINKVPCPLYIVEGADLHEKDVAVTRPKTDNRADEILANIQPKQPTITLTKGELEEIVMTTALLVSDRVFETLQQK